METKNYLEQKRKWKERDKREIDAICQTVQIVDYAAAYLGKQPVRIGKYYTFSAKEGDSYRIDPVKNCYWRNSKTRDEPNWSGNIINFVMLEENLTFKEAVMRLKPMATLSPIPAAPPSKAVQKPTELILPERDIHSKNVFAYLNKTRGIDGEIISALMKSRHIYQSKKHKNCVFVSYDDTGKPVFGCLRGTYTNPEHPKRFLGDLPGCDYNWCFYLNHQADAMIVTESVIDALSVATMLKRKGRNWQEFNYLALSGVDKTPAVFHHCDASIRKVIVATDRDEGGKKALRYIQEGLLKQGFSGKVIPYLPTTGKDWNEALLHHILQEAPARYDVHPPPAGSRSISSLLSGSSQPPRTTHSKGIDR